MYVFMCEREGGDGAQEMRESNRKEEEIEQECE